jgi:DNA-binding beta-propeller fold protein YncE
MCRKAACIVLLLLAPFLTAAGKTKDNPKVLLPPDLLLPEGRKLTYERSFRAEKDVRKEPGFWGKVLNVVAGEPEYRELIRPYGIAVDSHGRAIITDPGARGIHIFDFEQRKYKFIERADKNRDPMVAPQCVAVDAEDNFYVTDSQSGKIFVFEASGKFKHVLGSLKGGEGYFKRPTGIAVDSAAQRIYVTDTLRDKIFVLDMQGSVMQTIGKHGTGKEEFYYPTELRLDEQNTDGHGGEKHDLMVVDAMNFRVQRVGRDGAFEGAIGQVGDSVGSLFRPKGIGIDSEGHLYVVDGLSGVVQVYDREGRLLYSFGGRGQGLGEFQLPMGLFIDRHDRIFVVDSFNRRVQVYRYYGLSKQARGATP